MHILLIQHIQQEFINQNQLNTKAYHGNKSKHTIKQYKDYFLTIMQSRLSRKNQIAIAIQTAFISALPASLHNSFNWEKRIVLR